MNIIEEREFVCANVDRLAELAEGQFIDLSVRPKSKRKKFEREMYRDAVMTGNDWWKDQPEELQSKYLNGCAGFAMQAMNQEFVPERVRWIYSMFCARPDPKQEQADREKDVLRKRLRIEQATMNAFDANIRCLNCGKFIHLYDEKNNRRHEKEEVCTCTSSHTLQSQMAERVSAYRKHLEDEKKRKERKKQR